MSKSTVKMYLRQLAVLLLQALDGPGGEEVHGAALLGGVEVLALLCGDLFVCIYIFIFVNIYCDVKKMVGVLDMVWVWYILCWVVSWWVKRCRGAAHEVLACGGLCVIVVFVIMIGWVGLMVYI